MQEHQAQSSLKEPATPHKKKKKTTHPEPLLAAVGRDASEGHEDDAHGDGDGQARGVG